MARVCSHLDVITDTPPSGPGCLECTLTGSHWMHLRRCVTCGHVGCCDSSPNRHATAHFVATADHPVVQSYEPGEDWFWCYVDEVSFDLAGEGPSPSHP
jgi:uncharacterized UBP type Zn finger protein